VALVPPPFSGGEQSITAVCTADWPTIFTAATRAIDAECLVDGLDGINHIQATQCTGNRRAVVGSIETSAD